jgi:hypothetical protein
MPDDSILFRPMDPLETPRDRWEFSRLLKEADAKVAEEKEQQNKAAATRAIAPVTIPSQTRRTERPRSFARVQKEPASVPAWLAALSSVADWNDGHWMLFMVLVAMIWLLYTGLR